MFHVVLCKDERPVNARDVANWILDAAAFEDIPRFNPPFEGLDNVDWVSFDVIYDEQKRPVQIFRFLGEEAAARGLAAIDCLRDRAALSGQDALVERLSRVRQALSIEFDELLCDESVWELLDSLEMRLARELDGVTFSDDEGFFDAENRPICSFT